jgi:hypothetical protein
MASRPAHILAPQLQRTEMRLAGSQWKSDSVSLVGVLDFCDYGARPALLAHAVEVMQRTYSLA